MHAQQAHRMFPISAHDAVRTEVMTDSDSDTDDGHTKFKPIKELYVQLEI
jgi:hypothetical protein